MSAERLVVAPEPLCRRLSLGPDERASLSAFVPVRIELKAFESVARATIERFDAFRLEVVRQPDAPPLIRLGPTPEITFTDDGLGRSSAASNAGPSREPSPRNRVDV